MGTTYKKPGDVLTLTAPAGGVTVDVPVLIGGILVIPTVTAAAGEDFTGMAVGVHELPKTSAQAWTEGARIYWDDGNSRCDTDSTVGPLVGVAEDSAANPSSTGRVRLNGVSSELLEGTQAAIADLSQDISASYTEAEVQAISDKVDAILAALRTIGIIST